MRGPAAPRAPAYAKVMTRERQFFVRKSKFTLGRELLARPPMCDYAIGDDRTISRSHVEIEYERDERCFFVRVLGKNSIVVNTQVVTRGTRIPLREPANTLKIGNECVYFLLPRDASQQRNGKRRAAGKDKAHRDGSNHGSAGSGAGSGSAKEEIGEQGAAAEDRGMRG